MKKLALILALCLPSCVAQRTKNIKVYDSTTPTNLLRMEIDGTTGLTGTSTTPNTTYTLTTAPLFQLFQDSGTPRNDVRMSPTSLSYRWNSIARILLQPGNAGATGGNVQLYDTAGTLLGVELDGQGTIDARSAFHAFKTRFAAGGSQTTDYEISAQLVQTNTFWQIYEVGGGTQHNIVNGITGSSSGTACNDRWVGNSAAFITNNANSQTGFSSAVYPCTATDSRNYFQYRGAVRPAVDATWALGTTSLRWSDVIGDNITARGSSVRLQNSSGTLLAYMDISSGHGRFELRNSSSNVRVSAYTGASGNGVVETYSSAGAIQNTLDGSGFTGPQLTVNGSSFQRIILPQADFTYDVGSSSVRWLAMYSEAINLYRSSGGTLSISMGNGVSNWYDTGGTGKVLISANNTIAGGIVRTFSAAGVQMNAMDNGGFNTTVGYAANGTAGINHTTTHACAGTQVFTMGLLTATTGTC